MMNKVIILDEYIYVQIKFINKQITNWLVQLRLSFVQRNFNFRFNYQIHFRDHWHRLHQGVFKTKPIILRLIHRPFCFSSIIPFAYPLRCWTETVGQHWAFSIPIKYEHALQYLSRVVLQSEWLSNHSNQNY